MTGEPEITRENGLETGLARSRLRGRCFHLAHTAYFGPITVDPEIDLPAKLDTTSYNRTQVAAQCGRADS